MIKRINLIIATVYSIVLAVVEALLNWGDWQYAPLWIVDYLIVIILLLGVFVYKENQRKVLLLGWSFSSGVMYMALFINLESSSTLTRLDSNILSKKNLEYLSYSGSFNDLEKNRNKVFQSINILSSISNATMEKNLN